MCLLLAKVCPSSSSGYQQPLKVRETFMNPSTAQAGMWTPSYSRCSYTLKPTRASHLYPKSTTQGILLCLPCKISCWMDIEAMARGPLRYSKIWEIHCLFHKQTIFLFFFPRAARNSLDTPGEKTARCWSIPEKRWPHGLWLCVMASGASPAAMSQPQLQGKQGLTSSPKCS